MEPPRSPVTGADGAADGAVEAAVGADGARARQTTTVGSEAEPIDEAVLEDELLEEEVATLPQHSTFGSVWESQIGSTPSIPSVSGEPADDDEPEDEPEIPSTCSPSDGSRVAVGVRAVGVRAVGVRPVGSGGYRTAIDRERYGRGGAPTTGGCLARTDRGQGRAPGPNRSQPQPRPQPQRSAPPPREARPTGSSEPWSEVPADVQELLKAELARRQGGAAKGRPASVPATPRPRHRQRRSQP